jgi:lipopolysaccharide export system protein LptA
MLVLPFSLPYIASAQAYLAEDRVHDGADTYTVDYEKKIIQAVGHAFFRKQKRRIDADRIIIYYAEDKKIAYFYDNVVLTNEADGSVLTGNYAEARFREEFYYIEGDTVYRDDKRTITSQKAEAKEGEGYTFIDNVRYSDGTYVITASSLHIGDVQALFKENVHALQVKSGDNVYCDELTYFVEQGNMSFHNRVLYIEGNDEKGGDSLVVKSHEIRYFHDDDMFILIGDVYILTDKYTLRSSLVRYYKGTQVLKATGDIVVFDGEKYVYCNNLEYYIDEKRALFYNSARGIFKQKTKL